jgi:hypothetical protein
VFITQSRLLATRVQDYYRNLTSESSAALRNMTQQCQEEGHAQEEDLLADLDDEDASAFGLPPKYSMLEDKHFPLFLTYDQAS